MYFNETLPGAFTYQIGLKNRKGEYYSETRRFNNKKHFDNWYDKVTSKGQNVLGVFETKDVIDYNSELISDEMFIKIASIERNYSILNGTSEIKNYFIQRTDNGDYIKYLTENSCYNIIMFRNNQFSKWSDSRLQQSFGNFVHIEKYLL